MSRSNWIQLAIVAAVILLAYRTVYTVDETQHVVITRFGRPVAQVTEQGPGAKLPWDRIWRLDNRLQTYGPGPSPFLTHDKKMLQIDNYDCWRIVAPKRYLETVADVAMATSAIPAMAG